MQTQTDPYLAIQGYFSYTVSGDSVLLYADQVANNHATQTSGNVSLQLWAASDFYQGGELSGHLVAKVSLEPILPLHLISSLQYSLAASFPPAGDYTMVLALVEETEKGPVIHDYRNFDRREYFVHPRIDGNVGYHLEADSLQLEVNAVTNPRDGSNLSGTLCLQLWALKQPYSGRELNGHRLTEVLIGTLAGGNQYSGLSYQQPYTAPGDGTYYLALLLREWNGSDYSTRDYTNFAVPVEFPLEAQDTAPQTPRKLETEPIAAAKPATANKAPAKKVAKKVPAKNLAVKKTAPKPEASKAQAKNVAPRKVAAKKAPAKPRAIFLNRADEAELAALPGITAAVAKRIVQERPFKSLTELEKVKGIGQDLVAKLRDSLNI